MGFEKHDLDFALVPAGLLLLSSYHAWLLYRIKRHPTTTVVGLNALNKEIWVDTMMADGIKNGVLAIQTVRNSIMASTLLATTAITLSSLIGILVGSSGSGGVAAAIIYGDDSRTGSSVKYLAILVCFLTAFLFNVQSIRYYSHVSFLIAVPLSKPGEGHSQWYVSRTLNRASYFWSLGLRAFYFSFPLFFWTFGPIPMFLCCCIMIFTLYFLDTATSDTDASLFLSLPRTVEEGCSPKKQGSSKV